MIYRVESILDIEVQDNLYAILSSQLFSEDAVLFSELALCSSTAAESFLRVIHEPIVFGGVFKTLVYIDSTMERRREYLVQMQPIGRKFDRNVASCRPSPLVLPTNDDSPLSMP
jgi:hypothetical protein